VEPSSKPREESEVGGVAERLARRIRPDRQLKSNSG
jgi:hypothetical protein